MRRKLKGSREDELAGVFPLLQRGPGGIPLPPKPPTGTTQPPTPTTTTPGGTGTGPTTGAPKPGGGKYASGGKGTSTGKSGSSSTSTATTYSDYLKAQKAEANKTSRRTANKYIMSAEGLRAQANALLVLLGKQPGGGANPFHVGGKGGKNGNGLGGHSTGTDMQTTVGGGKKDGGYGGGSGNGVKPGLGGGPGGGPGTGPGTKGHGGKLNPDFDPGTTMPRTNLTGRMAATGEGAGARPGVGPGTKGHGGKSVLNDDGPRGTHGPKEGKRDDKGKGLGGGKGRGGNGDGGRNLSNEGLSGELKVNLRNVERAMKTADDLLVSQYGERVAELGKAAGDNDKAVNAQGFANISNRGRERANAISEIAAQGAGESDAARAQGMSLRNWEQNQLDVNRSFFDTLTTINSSLKDTTIDTRTARVQNKQQALDDKQQLWNSYFDAKSEAYTQLGNTYGQMATDYGNAQEASPSKKAKRRQKRLQGKSADAFMKAAQVGKQSHKEPAVGDELTQWQGAADFEGRLNNNVVQQSGQKQAVPEGATLRKWNA